MWIVKGVLLGILLFVVGGITYVGIRIAIAVYLVKSKHYTQLRRTMGHSGIARAIAQSGFLGCVLGSDCNWVVDHESTNDPDSMRKWPVGTS